MVGLEAHRIELRAFSWRSGPRKGLRCINAAETEMNDQEIIKSATYDTIFVLISKPTFWGVSTIARRKTRYCIFSSSLRFW